MAEIKTVAMIGVGAMGSFFLPRLLNTLGEDRFRVIAGGTRKERLETRGVTINGVNYKLKATDPSDSCDPADLVIIAVKSTALDEALRDIHSQVGPDTVIMAVLNGVDSEERVAAVYGMERVLHSFMRVSIVMEDYTTTWPEDQGLVQFGERINDELSPRVKAVKELFDRCGIPNKIPRDMIHAQWFKFMANVGENMVCALLGVPFGAFQTSDDANVLRYRAMEEVIAIANKKGIALGQKELDIQERTVQRLNFQNKPSTLQDIEAGRRTEVDMFAGEVVRLGKEAGVPTPVNELLYHAIKVLEQKNEGRFD